ncbi:MAG TPA: lysylphosphatidylglycerol synthase transmembrane domain-containing protein [Stellaceae bacterium]|nr:lysylphosphatidylglycerol synthase transmembrane domain-containing protein [Stellaceae bacterium]
MTDSVPALRPTDALRAIVARFAGVRHLPLFLKLAVSIGFVALISRHVDGRALIERLHGQSLFWLAGTALLGLVQIALLSVRWQQILKALGGESGFGSAVAVTYMGCFFGAFLFGPTGGDVARAMLAPSSSLGRRGIVHSVLFERVASVIGLGLAVTPLVLFDVGPFARSAPLLATLAVVPASFVGIALIVWLARAIGDRAGALFFPLRGIDRSWHRVARRWPRFAATVALATIGQLLVAVEAWTLAQAQHLGVSLIDFAILMPPVMLVVALPISAGGWGVREGAVVAALALVGVGTAPALVLSVELGLIGTLVSLPGGAIWLRRCFLRLDGAARDN